MAYGSLQDRSRQSSIYTYAVSVRVTEEDMKFLKRSAEANCRTLAEEVRFLIKEARMHRAEL